jgi:hypothetical protein
MQVAGYAGLQSEWRHEWQKGVMKQQVAAELSLRPQVDYIASADVRSEQRFYIDKPMITATLDGSALFDSCKDAGWWVCA